MHMEVNNGAVVASAGTVVVLTFNALHAGTGYVTCVDRGPWDISAGDCGKHDRIHERLEGRVERTVDEY